MKAKILRPLFGMLLIIISILAMVWWEKSGREQLIMDSVLITKENIISGTVIGKNDFIEIKNIPQSTIPGAITPESFYKINGLVAKQDIPKMAQVIPGMFMRKDKILMEGSSIFPVKDTWIDCRSSSVRKGILLISLMILVNFM
ncbi:hypothetical protein [Aminipila terrae]|uniref:SAF domain-containing protein n=1 Tax=Aminipila terrae TaxID=2697030 RepID=A0A6P1MEQ4_9FIRM|nr:hypothetical protein [Aminipila terrae]QHI73179.1 hypothetical protein Ami3637_13070 [Aminipila terrae]